MLTKSFSPLWKSTRDKTTTEIQMTAMIDALPPNGLQPMFQCFPERRSCRASQQIKTMQSTVLAMRNTTTAARREKLADQNRSNGGDGQRQRHTPEHALDQGAFSEAVKVGDPGGRVTSADHCGKKGCNREETARDLLRGDRRKADNSDLLSTRKAESAASTAVSPSYSVRDTFPRTILRGSTLIEGYS